MSKKCLIPIGDEALRCHFSLVYTWLLGGMLAGTSLLALIDDIATIMDDVALMTKMAAKKTTGVIGDDLALNAQQVAGIRADRELPVVWAVAKGSLRNKLILVPSALAISTFIPGMVGPILMIGGVFLCYEGFEKIVHKYLHKEKGEKEHHDDLIKALTNSSIDMEIFEKEKISGAIKTDFVLSAEIIAIALGTVANLPFGIRVGVLASIALIMTVIVYGFVACVVKLDDGGLYLSRKNDDSLSHKIQRVLGKGLLRIAPYLMKFLSVAGVIAMFTVGGSILLHGVPAATRVVHNVIERAELVPAVGGALRIAVPVLIDILAGVLVGAISVFAVKNPAIKRRPAEEKE